MISGYLIGGIVYGKRSRILYLRQVLPTASEANIARFSHCSFLLYLAAILLLSPIELRQFVVTALATIFSVSNVNLTLTTGYFTNRSRFNPLLMTWSLAVEEQFYVLFPIAMLAVVRRKRDFALHPVAICSILSFGLSVRQLAVVRPWHFLYYPLELGRLAKNPGSDSRLQPENSRNFSLKSECAGSGRLGGGVACICHSRLSKHSIPWRRSSHSCDRDVPSDQGAS